MSKLNGHAPTNLVKLFNSNVDFVRKTGDHVYEPVDWPKFATHRLDATTWNTKDKFRPNSKGKIVQPDGYALSVVATPLKIKFSRTTLEVKRKFPSGKLAPIYYANGSEDSKRKVLRHLIDLMGAPKKFKRLIKIMDAEDLDVLYRNLIRASRIKFNQ